jgi:hypothetical protein
VINAQSCCEPTRAEPWVVNYRWHQFRGFPCPTTRDSRFTATIGSQRRAFHSGVHFTAASVHSGVHFNAECLIIIHASVNTDKQASRRHYQSITAEPLSIVCQSHDLDQIRHHKLQSIM